MEPTTGETTKMLKIETGKTGKQTRSLTSNVNSNKLLKRKKVIVGVYFNETKIHRPQSNAATLQPMDEAAGCWANQRAAGAFKS